MTNSNKLILLVSSNQILNERIRKYLAHDKYDIRCLKMDDDSLKTVLNKDQYDLVIVDSELPGWQGIRTGVMIRCWSNIPILILSTNNTHNNEIRMLDIESDDYLSNPVEAAYLALKIDRLLSADSPLMGI